MTPELEVTVRFCEHKTERYAIASDLSTGAIVIMRWENEAWTEEYWIPFKVAIHISAVAQTEQAFDNSVMIAHDVMNGDCCADAEDDAEEGQEPAVPASVQ